MLNPVTLSTYPSTSTSEKPGTAQSASDTRTNTPVTGDPLQTAVQGAVPAAGQASQSNSEQSSTSKNKNFDNYECQTCKNRKYTDGSNDPGVSYKTPTTISADKATSAVRAHENEHVTRERASASREGREVVSQSVTYQSAICAECGQSYTSGGTTRTVTKKQVEETYGLTDSNNIEETGRNLDQTA